jgi:hypothetical protein
MWRVMLGMAVCLQAGALRAGEGEGPGAAQTEEKTAAPPACPGRAASNEASGDGADQDCAKDDGVVAAPATAPTATLVAAPAVAAARSAFATVSFRNEVGTKLRLVEAHFTMDGADLPTVLTDPERGKSYVVATKPVLPGPHIVTARLTYQGEPRVFSYMKGYKLNVKSDQVLTAAANRPVSFTVVGTENRGMTVPLDKRVVVKVEER